MAWCRECERVTVREYVCEACVSRGRHEVELVSCGEALGVACCCDCGSGELVDVLSRCGGPRVVVRPLCRWGHERERCHVVKNPGTCLS